MAAGARKHTQCDSLLIGPYRGAHTFPCIVELGLVYVCDLLPAQDGRFHASIAMTLTAPGCVHARLPGERRGRQAAGAAALPHVEEVNVDMVFDPPWDRSRMSEAAQLALGV